MRLFDASPVNDVANLPAVAALLGYGDRYDFTSAIEDRRNVFLERDGAFALCTFSAPFVYECHLLIHPSCRGKRMVSAVLAMRDHMFANFAEILWGQPQRWNAAAIKLIELVGFSRVGEGAAPVIGEVFYYRCLKGAV